MNHSQENYRDKQVESGLCQSGDGRSLASKRLCHECLQRMRKYGDQNISRGLCRSGDGRPLKSKRLCAVCLQRSRKWHQKHLIKGLCAAGDGNPLASKTLCRECLQKMQDRRQARRRKAMKLIADAHEVKIGCMFNIHPNMPSGLARRECWGDLRFEHPNGGGTRDQKTNGKEALFYGILNGTRNPKEYLLLCRLHQIWNG